jgi:predicted MPP superfamily phosphohydrolase
MKRSPRRRGKIVALVSVFAVGVQIPAVVTIGHLLGHQLWSLAGAALLTLPFLFSPGGALRNPFQHQRPSRAQMYGVMWPFYLWWTICLTYLLFALPALLIAALTRVSLDQALVVAGVLSIIAGTAALRRRPRIVTHGIAIADLSPELEGYRIVQLTDLHCGPFTPPARIRRWVERANALEPDLIAVTGDLITSGAEYVERVAEELGGLRAPDGVVGCMGNHDYFTDGEVLARALEQHGMQVLRNRGLTISRGGGRLYVAGVDDTWTGRNDVPAALRGRPAAVPTILLAHDPDLFVEAVAQGVDLTISGHTHGGQLAVPGATRQWNLARIVTRFTAGLYHEGRSTLYVSRGLGTTGPPVRLGARPEITVLRLQRAHVTEAPMHALAEEVIRDASGVA